MVLRADPDDPLSICDRCSDIRTEVRELHTCPRCGYQVCGECWDEVEGICVDCERDLVDAGTEFGPGGGV